MCVLPSPPGWDSSASQRRDSSRCDNMAWQRPAHSVDRQPGSSSVTSSKSLMLDGPQKIGGHDSVGEKKGSGPCRASSTGWRSGQPQPLPKASSRPQSGCPWAFSPSLCSLIQSAVRGCAPCSPQVFTEHLLCARCVRVLGTHGGPGPSNVVGEGR